MGTYGQGTSITDAPCFRLNLQLYPGNVILKSATNNQIGGKQMVKFLKENKAALVIICAAAVFLIVGVFNGEAATVFQKATNICLECIGIG